MRDEKENHKEERGEPGGQSVPGHQPAEDPSDERAVTQEENVRHSLRKSGCPGQQDANGGKEIGDSLQG
ncbi:MAG TPA: hypothetical protein VGR03_09430 [Candidatus Acidoferrum sp.]|nr:hypothetical protein [Candidatus Acidoferrum sp.]